MFNLFCLLLFATYDGGISCVARRPTAYYATAFEPPGLLRKKISFLADRRQLSTAALRVKDFPSNEDLCNDAAPADATNTRKFLIPAIALFSVSLASLAAYTQHLPGPPIDPMKNGIFFVPGSCNPYSPALIYRDAASAIISLVGAALFVKAITYSNKIGKIESRDSRKLIHSFAAPVFMLLWPIFSHAYGARIFVSIIPIINTLKLILAATDGSGSASELAGAISRSGDAKEALGGPLIYALVLLFCTLFLWTDSYIGVVSICNMALGDGLADLVGRRLGSSNKWFFNESKSMAGSAAFVTGAFFGSYGLISWLTSMGAMDALDMSAIGLAVRLLSIAVVCAGVELIPVGDDNWSVPLSAAVMTAILLN